MGDVEVSMLQLLLVSGINKFSRITIKCGCFNYYGLEALGLYN